MTVRDEVCGMTMEPEAAPNRTYWSGRIYYFCSPRCKQLFLARPHWYVPVGTTELHPDQGHAAE